MEDAAGGVDVISLFVYLSSKILVRPLVSLLICTLSFRSGSGASSRASNVDVAPTLGLREDDGELVGLSLDRLRMKVREENMIGG